MKLNKLERYTAYCILLQEIETTNANFTCIAWFEIFDEIVFRDDEYNLRYILPELWDKRTSVPFGSSSAWFSYREERIAALEQCIKETHP